MKTYVNLGCGSRFHPSWTNYDLEPRHAGVLQCDLSRGVPRPDNSSDVVYHSAVFEHIRRGDALPFLCECLRILRPGGIIRLGVPDLEQICRLYLGTLERAANGDPTAAGDYDWVLIELIDQMVRERGGGEMLAYLQQNPLPNEAFIYERIGVEGRELVANLRPRPTSAAAPADGTPQLAISLRKLSQRIRNRILQALAGPDAIRALQIGRFRLSGEVHQWMYDRYSLARLLVAAGFQKPILQSATTSQIPAWNSFFLDTLPDGSVIKPDLFFMEAIKPQVPAAE